MAAFNLSYCSCVGSSRLTSSQDLFNPICLSTEKKITFKFSNTDAFSLKSQAFISVRRPRSRTISAAMATGSVREVLPPALDSTSEPPPLFDGTTRLYISYTCPYAQRVWTTRNCKGLQEEIKLVPIDLQNRPAWYKEKVYPANKVILYQNENENL